MIPYELTGENLYPRYSFVYQTMRNAHNISYRIMNKSMCVQNRLSLYFVMLKYSPQNESHSKENRSMFVHTKKTIYASNKNKNCAYTHLLYKQLFNKFSPRSSSTI